MTLTRVRHVAVAVHDLESATPFYRDLLQLPVIQETRTSLLLGAGKSAVLLTEDEREWVEASGEGIHHLLFEVADGEDAPDGLLPREEHLGLGIRLAAAEPAPVHGGSAIAQNIDHVVIASNDSGATAAHFELKLGLEIKRKMIRPGTNAQLAFGKLEDVILEFAGPPEPRPGELRAKFWGLVFTVGRLDEVVARVREAGLPCDDPKPAVQPGARIATVKAGTGGVPTALIEYGVEI